MLFYKFNCTDQVYNWEIRHHPLVCCRGLADILYIFKTSLRGSCNQPLTSRTPPPQLPPSECNSQSRQHQRCSGCWSMNPTCLRVSETIVSSLLCCGVNFVQCLITSSSYDCTICNTKQPLAADTGFGTNVFHLSCNIWHVRLKLIE